MITTESQAVSQVQEQYPDKFVTCFGESTNGFDVAVYESEDDFDADAEENSNDRMIARVAVA